MICSNVASFRWKSHGAKNSNLFLSFFYEQTKKKRFVGRCVSVFVNDQ